MLLCLVLFMYASAAHGVNGFNERRWIEGAVCLQHGEGLHVIVEGQICLVYWRDGGHHIYLAAICLISFARFSPCDGG